MHKYYHQHIHQSFILNHYLNDLVDQELERNLPMKLTSMLSIIALLGVSSYALPQQKKAPKKPVPPNNQTKGREQQVGGPGVFGTTYSVRGYVNNFNISLDKAWYDVAAPSGYGTMPQRTEKFLYTNWSIKNTAAGSQGMPGDGIPVSLVFADGNTKDDYVHFYRRADSLPLNLDFKPGQGVDDVVGVLTSPAEARVTKIILNVARVQVTNEQVIRYFIVGGGTDTKPDPKNVIAPLPNTWRDKTDSFGAKALETANAEIGQEYQISMFATTLESVTLADKFGETAPGDGQQLLIATLKIRNPLGMPIGFGTTGMRNGMELLLVDGDGETANVSSQWFKASREEPVGDHDIKPGDSYRVRVVFAIRKPDKPLKSITLREDEYKSRGLSFDAAKLGLGK